MIEKEEEAKKQEAIQRRAANAPAPGVRPKRAAKTAPPRGNGASVAGDSDAESDAAEADSDGVSDAATAKTQANKPVGNNSPGNRTPRPGARPKRRKR